MIKKDDVKFDIVDLGDGTLWVVSRAIALIPVKHELKVAIMPYAFFDQCSPEYYCMLLNTNFAPCVERLLELVVDGVNVQKILLGLPGGGQEMVEIDHKKMNEFKWVTFEKEGIDIIREGNETLINFLNKGE